MTRTFIAAALALLIPIGFAYLGGVKALGAHHWWDFKTALIGAPIGLIIAIIIEFITPLKPAKVMGFLALLALAFADAKYSQIQFVASYGEDQFAGKMWYFGWIATAAAASGAIFSAVK